MTVASLRIGPHGSWNTYLTTSLNSLADDAHKVGAAIDNDSRYPRIRHQITLGSWTPTAGGTVDLYQIPGVEDGSVSPSIAFNEGDNTNAPQETWLAFRFRLRAAAAAQTLVTPPLILERYSKWALVNRSGAALAASGHNWSYRYEDLTMET